MINPVKREAMDLIKKPRLGPKPSTIRDDSSA